MPEATDRPSDFIVDIEALIKALPDSPADLEEERKRVADALSDFHSPENPLATAVEECIRTLRELHDSLHRKDDGSSHVTQSLPELEFHDRKTMAIPADAVKEAVEAAVAGDKAIEKETVNWTADERMLYQDVLTLFDLGDQPGAMTSMERLIMLSPSAEELQAFVEKNGESLKRLYEENFGSFDRVPVPVSNSVPVRIPTQDEALVKDILDLVDGHRTIQDILEQSEHEDLFTLVSIAHLARSGYLELA